MYWCKYHIYQNFLKCPKNGTHEFHAIVYAKETYVRYACYLLTSRDTFLNLFSLATISYVHQYVLVVVITLIAWWWCVKLIVIQLELNGIRYKLVLHSYSKSTSNTWYTLICKVEKYKPNPQKIHGYEHI